MTAVRTWRAPVSIAVAVVVIDQLTKHWAVTSLGTDREIDLFWTLRFNLGFNNGMAFGQGQGFGPVIAVVATLVIVYLLVTLRNEASRMSTIGMGLLIGGAAGNLTDRLFRGDDGVLRGAVVDFIDFQWFPIFNIADMCINVGAGLLILNSILSARADRRVESVDEETDPIPTRADGGIE
jgi:signal peptidase II